jgi:hypothetical protein
MIRDARRDDTKAAGAQRGARRGRLRAMGTALVEATFLMPMFVILFFATLYAHNLGYGHMKENREARAAAWALAMSNCNDSGDSDSEVLPGANTGGSGAASRVSLTPSTEPLPGGGDPTSMLSGLMGTIASGVAQAIPINADSAKSEQTKDLSWRLPNLYEHDASRKQTSIKQTATITCNNAPKNGGLVATLLDMGESVASVLHL